MIDASNLERRAEPPGELAVGDWSPLEDDVLLKGTLTVVVRRRDGRPCPKKWVLLRGCGFL
jgi:hypothetical protein